MESYFDIEWCDDVSDLRCVHCHRVAIQPYVSNCQHIFCKLCRKFYSDEDQRLNCPRCQEQITRLDEENFEVEVKLHQLKIFCPNKKYGCKYAEQLRNLPSHLMVCMNTRKAAAAALQVEAPPTNTMADVVNLLTNLNSTIGELKEEIREVKNKVDQLEKKSDAIGTKADLQLAFKNHTEESMKLLLESLNERIQLNESLEQQKKALKVDEIQAEIALVFQNTALKKSEKLIPQKAETYEWTIKDVEKNIRSHDCIYESEVFKFPGCNYDIKARICISNQTPTIDLQFKDDDIINLFRSNHVFTTVTYIVRDQSDLPKKEAIQRKVYLKFDDGHCLLDWILDDSLPDEILAPPYLKNDCIKISILFEPQSLDRNFISNNGVLLWRVDNYKMRKKERKLQDIWSPPFYTSPKGYRVRIKLSVSYSRSISVEVYFLAGEHDSTLDSYFFHDTIATLINQTDPSENLVKRKKRSDIEWYAIELKSGQSIERNGFVKDDSLLLEVVIEPFNSSCNPNL